MTHCSEYGWLAGLVYWLFGLCMRIKLSLSSNWNNKRSFTCNLQIYTIYTTQFPIYSCHIPFHWALNIFFHCLVRKEEKRNKTFLFSFRFNSIAIEEKNVRLWIQTHAIFSVMSFYGLLLYLNELQTTHFVQNVPKQYSEIITNTQQTQSFEIPIFQWQYSNRN